MSVTKINYWDKQGRLRQCWDTHFVYTAYAPIDDESVFVKVGISTSPYQRFVTIHCNCPYPIGFAAFAPAGLQRQARAIEKRILLEFSEFKTRGEWLKLPTDAETKKRFAAALTAAFQSVLHKAPEWQRATGKEIKAFMASKMKDRE